MSKLGKEQIVTIEVLREKGQSNTQIARTLGVSEGAIRYHARRQAQRAVDGRTKPSLIEQQGLQEAVQRWWDDQLEVLPKNRAPNLSALHDRLVEEHRYAGSVKSVRKYVRQHFPKPKLRPFRRVETPPGAQTQSDWLETTIDIGEGPQKLYGFVMVLSHSRKSALIWSRSMNQLHWHRVHNEAFKRLGGIAAVNRIDNLKTGVSRGSGPWGAINPNYQAYANLMGFHVDPHEVRAPEQKGKVERRVGCVKEGDFTGLCFQSLEHLQAYTDEKIRKHERRRICPVTGKTVERSWLEERKLLRPLPSTLPQPFDLFKSCPVHKDCTIRFEGRTYSVPFAYMGRRVSAYGCAGVVQIVDPREQKIIQEHPRHTERRLLIDPSCYEGDATATVAAPKPLGRFSKALQKLMEERPRIRSMEIYSRLAEAAT